MKRQSRQESILYATLWAVLFLAPLMSMFVRYKSGDTDVFVWEEVFHVWRQFAGFFLLFLLHNYVLAPLVVYRQRQGRYIACMVGLFVVFSLFQCATQPDDLKMQRHEMNQRHVPFDKMDEERPPLPPHHRHGPRHKPFVLDWHDAFSIITLALILGTNLAIKFYIKGREDQKKLIELERESLAQQLEYLKYQINPHFFMNTLNNIHALVDIDPEKAKSTIVELSKMMRFILYEGDKNGVPLSREFDFIRNYITLMRLRYTDKVKILVDLPAEAPDRTVPPLMLISFIENAFKHGISYQHPSFIDIRVSIDGDKLRFTCRNSKADKPNQEKGGVGLANVKQRLHLLYDHDFTLTIDDQPDIYQVNLTIPLV